MCVCVDLAESQKHLIAYNLGYLEISSFSRLAAVLFGYGLGFGVNVCIIFPSSPAGQLARMQNFQCHFSEKSENLKLVPDNMYRI